MSDQSSIRSGANEEGAAYRSSAPAPFHSESGAKGIDGRLPPPLANRLRQKRPLAAPTNGRPSVRCTQLTTPEPSLHAPTPPRPSLPRTGLSRHANQKSGPHHDADIPIACHGDDAVT